VGNRDDLLPAAEEEAARIEGGLQLRAAEMDRMRWAAAA